MSPSELEALREQFVLAYGAHVERSGGGESAIKVKVYDNETDEERLVDPVDAKEYVKSGRYRSGDSVPDPNIVANAVRDDPAPKWDQVQALDAYTRGHGGNTVKLIEYLRGIARDCGEKLNAADLAGLSPIERMTAARAAGSARNAPALEPQLATLIADALEQGWKPSPFKSIDPAYLHSLRDNIMVMLKAGHPDAVDVARALGADPALTEAGNAIGALLLHLSGPDEFQWLHSPRAGRHLTG